jgi:hypothetical protein
VCGHGISPVSLQGVGGAILLAETYPAHSPNFTISDPTAVAERHSVSGTRAPGGSWVGVETWRVGLLGGRGSFGGRLLGRTPALFQLFAHSRRGLQIRPGLKQVLPQIIALAGQRFESPVHLSGLLLMLFGSFLDVLPGAVDLEQPLTLGRA